MKAKENLSKIKAYIPGKSIAEVSQELGLTDIIKMASNENPLGCGLDLNQLQDTFANIHVYPHQASAPLKQDLCTMYGIGNDSLILGNGSDEVIQMLAAAFLREGEEIITSKHTFSVYGFVTHLFGGELKESEMGDDYRYDVNGILKQVSEKTRLVFIANPNNPTGTILRSDEIEFLLSQLRDDILLVIDEAYGEYVDDPSYPNSIELSKKYPNLVVLRTFSKLYGLAGMRIGYGIGSASVIQTLQKIRQPFNINSLALKAAELALKNKAHIEKSLDVNRKGKAYLSSELSKLGLSVLPSQANFLCVFLPIPGDQAMDALLKEGVIIRSLSSFGLKNGIRVSISTEEDNERFLAALKGVLQ